MLVNIAQGAEMPDLGCVFILPVYWVILTIAVPLIWLVFELQRTSASEKPLDWAKWHLSSEPEQAPANLNRVLEMQKAVILEGTNKYDYVAGVISLQQTAMVKSHPAVGWSWCGTCKAVVELDENMHCFLHPTAMISGTVLVVAELCILTTQ